MDNGRSTVQSLGKALDVLRAFTPACPEPTIPEVAAAAGLDRGTAPRLIHTPVGLGVTAGVDDTRRFQLTLTCLEPGDAALPSGGLRTRSTPMLRSLVPSVAPAASPGMLDAAGSPAHAVRMTAPETAA